MKALSIYDPTLTRLQFVEASRQFMLDADRHHAAKAASTVRSCGSTYEAQMFEASRRAGIDRAIAQADRNLCASR